MCLLNAGHHSSSQCSMNKSTENMFLCVFWKSQVCLYIGSNRGPRTNPCGMLHDK